MPDHEWREIGRVTAPDPSLVPNGVGIVAKEGHLTVWKLFEGGMDSGIYAIGRTLDTAIRAQESDWKMAHSLMVKDREICDEAMRRD